MNKNVFVVKGGIDDVGYSNSNSFHLICLNLSSNRGYFDKYGNGWKMYLSASCFSGESLRRLSLKGGEKYYTYPDTFEECIRQLEELLEKKAVILSRDEVRIYSKINKLLNE
ncbi:hypothetical protein G9409_00340 [Chlorobium sp. BLA1]|uniref:hypothetical protein n=1 Tax=Candidatus Chlorobium masyuteum TaxID=2716876 RepID=UPI0014248398|nr:hypothetical protein [Candidatus Chlorobium masyuteum]NHQ59048.1 hypothetical protein [Candidatus Chlorobium masyuteum]